MEDEIKGLLERWYEARTTDAEERILREWLRAADDLPPELDRARRMFAGLDALAEETMAVDAVVDPTMMWIESESMVSSHTSTTDQVAAPVAAPAPDSTATIVSTPAAPVRLWFRRARHVAMWTAAAAAVAVAVIGGEYLLRPYGYINGRPVRDAEVAMEATVYLEQLNAFDRSMKPFDEIMNNDNQK